MGRPVSFGAGLVHFSFRKTSLDGFPVILQCSTVGGGPRAFEFVPGDEAVHVLAAGVRHRCHVVDFRQEIDSGTARADPFKASVGGIKSI